MTKLFLAIFLIIVMGALAIYCIYFGIGVVKYLFENVSLIVKNPEVNFSIKNSQLSNILLFLLSCSLLKTAWELLEKIIKK